jgi:UDP-GlcNAc:undecaprenyl-phosphate GlcNAc-1-phosphate transferase
VGAVAGLFVCGLVDDLRSLSAPMKLAVQIAAGIGVFAAGFRIDHIVLPWVGPIALDWLALPATLLWIVAVTNAINLIDGLDGLATGVGLMITATVAAIAYVNGVRPVTVIALALAGSLLGFLPYNFSPARIFLGDSGSQFLGVTLAVISIRGAQKSATLVAILAPILVLGLPILDTFLVVLRRTWRIQGSAGIGGLGRRFALSRGLFLADREHIHHNLLELGLTDRKALLVLYVISAAFCLAAFGLVVLKNPTVAILLAISFGLGMVLLKTLAVRRRFYTAPRVVKTIGPQETPDTAPHPMAAGAKIGVPGSPEC